MGASDHGLSEEWDDWYNEEEEEADNGHGEEEEEEEEYGGYGGGLAGVNLRTRSDMVTGCCDVA